MNYKLKLAILPLALFISAVAYSQPITGKIVDSEGFPVIAAVVVLQNADSVYQLTTTTDTSGCFVLESSVSPYLLMISHLVYEQKTIADSVSDLGTITLNDKSTELGEVVVRERKKLIQVSDNGAMQFNAKLLAADKPVTTAIDLISEVPLIQRKGDEFKVAGTMSEAAIIINGRKTNISASQLKSLLEGMPASQVKSVEVFYDTPPRYGVKGPSINVVLEKKRSNSVEFRGDVYGEAIQRCRFIGIGGTNWSVSGKNWSLYSTYRYKNGRYKTDSELDSHHKVYDSVFFVRQLSNSKSHAQTHLFTTLFEVDFNNEASLELQYSGDFYKNKVNTTARLNVDSLQTESSLKGPSWDNTNSVSAEYTKNDLAIGTDFLFYKMDDRQDMLDSDKSVMVTNSKQQVTDFRAYFDNVNELSVGSLSYGIDADMSFTKNSYDENADGFMSVDNSDQREVELSGYAGWNHSFDKSSFNLSLELEYSRSDMKTDADTFNLWTNITPVPDLSFMYRFDNDNSLNVSLTGEKIYPSYWDNNNSKVYENPYLSIDGNPELKPYVDYVFNTEYVIKDKYVISAMAIYSPDHFAQLLYMQHDTLQAFYKHYNFDYSSTIGLVGTVPVDWNSRISSVFSVSGLCDFEKGHCEDVYFDRSKLYAIFEMSTDFVLNASKTLKGQISGWCQTPTIQGLLDMKSIGALSARISWTPNKHWNIDLFCDDLFYKGYYVTTNMGGQNYKDKENQYNQSVGISVRYTFNDFKAKDFKDVDTSRLGVQ